MKLIHKGCGGEVKEDTSLLPYEYDGQHIPAYSCVKCKMEILGDAQLDLMTEDGRIVDYDSLNFY